MSGWIIIFLIFIAVVLYFYILVRNFQEKESASNQRLNTHLTLLSSGIKNLAKKDEVESAHLDTSNVPNFNKVWEYPPSKEIVIEEVVHGELVPQDWDYAIHLHEATEQYLGTELFISLEKRVASIPGIDSCLHKDREVFLISSKNYPSEILTELFWREFLHAAEIAHILK